MQSEGKLTAKIPAPVKLIPQLAIMSLADNGWPPGLFNLIDEISVAKRKSQKAAGIGFELDFSGSIRWDAIGENQSGLTVAVKERTGNASADDCRQECFDIIKGIHERAATFVAALTAQSNRTTYGDARWALDQDLEAAGYLTDAFEANQLLVGPHTKRKYIAMPAQDTERHCLVCGPTGCGKTSTVFIPNLIHRTTSSAIVTEATAGSVQSDNPEEVPSEGPDLMMKTAGYRQLQGQKIYYFNPDDMTSHRINPLEGITTIRQAIRLANLLIRNTNIRENTSGDPFWETAETALLSSLIMHAAGEKGDLGKVRQYLRNGPEGLAQILAESLVVEARSRYVEFLRWSTENTRNSIVIGLMQRLELWTQPRIVALTQANDIDFDALKDELFTFYLAVPADKAELKPLAAIVFSYLLDYISAKKLKHDIALFLDEFTNFGFIPDFPKKMSIIRHRHIPAMLGIQDYAQAEDVYKQTAVLLFSQPATRIYFKPQTLAQAKIISESLGTETVYERSVSSSCQIQEKEFGRELMTSGAVQMLSKGSAIVFTADTPPLKLKRFAPGDHNYATQTPPPVRPVLKVDDSLVQACLSALEKEKWQEVFEASKVTKPSSESERITPAEEATRTSVPPNSSEVSSKEGKPKEKAYNEYGDRMPLI
jgi:type IV secretory pathway TraG/TraD family ATPase VirD4